MDLCKTSINNHETLKKEDINTITAQQMSNVLQFNNYLNNEISLAKFSFDNNFTHFLLWMNDVKSTIKNEILMNSKEIQLNKFSPVESNAEDTSRIYKNKLSSTNINLNGLKDKLKDCLKSCNKNERKRRKNLSHEFEDKLGKKKLKVNMFQEREIVPSSGDSKFNLEDELIYDDSNISEPCDDANIINQLESQKEDHQMHIIAEQPSREEELQKLSIDPKNEHIEKESPHSIIEEDKQQLSNFSIDNVLQNLNESDIRQLTGIKAKESPGQPTTCELTPIGFPKTNKRDSDIISMSNKLNRLAIESNETKGNNENIPSTSTNNINIVNKTPKAMNINFTFYKEKPQEKNMIQSGDWKDKASIYNMIFNNNQSYSKNEQSPVMIPKWNPVKSIANNEKNDNPKVHLVSSNVKSVNVLTSKKQPTNTLTKNVIEPQYEITDKSESSDEDSDYKNETPNFKKEKKQKEIPKWAKDNNYIFKRTQYQNKHLDAKEIFGQCKINYLNLNVIFYTEKQKYNKRGDSADWRLDNTLSSIQDDNNNGEKLSLKVNRQLFSEDLK